jgi:hypothetical protein
VRITPVPISNKVSFCRHIAQVEGELQLGRIGPCRYAARVGGPGPRHFIHLCDGVSPGFKVEGGLGTRGFARLLFPLGRAEEVCLGIQTGDAFVEVVFVGNVGVFTAFIFGLKVFHEFYFILLAFSQDFFELSVFVFNVGLVERKLICSCHCVLKLGRLFLLLAQRSHEVDIVAHQVIVFVFHGEVGRGPQRISVFHRVN